MGLTRTSHWATRELQAFFRAHARVPFEWGSNDCCIFPANAIRSFTGVDLAVEFRGKYTSEAEAFALIKSVTGGRTVADAAAYCAMTRGLVERAHPLMAQRGDLIVMLEHGASSPIAGIMHTSGRHVVTVGQEGLKRLLIDTDLDHSVPIHAGCVRVLRSWAI